MTIFVRDEPNPYDSLDVQTAKIWINTKNITSRERTSSTFFKN